MGLLQSTQVVAIHIPLGFFFFLHLMLMISTCDGHAVLCKAQEREALLQFKDGFSEANMISSWGKEDCCMWNGIGCDNHTGHVVELNLRGKTIEKLPVYVSPSLRGQISSSLVELKSLQRLDLSGNDFEGSPIPHFLGSLEMLTYLNLSLANFSGVVPQHLGNLSSLQVLDLSRMYKVESNGEWLSQLRQLRYLDMSDMNLTTANNLLEVLNMLPFLETLYLLSTYSNNYTPLHVQHVKFTRLLKLMLKGDQFVNPCWLFNITSLEYLHLDFHYLGFDVCPSGFTAKLCNLKSLILRSWSGLKDRKLSKFFMECNRRLDLVHLDLRYDLFFGQLPGWLGEYKSLEIVILENNILWGSLPESIGSMASLKKLSLGKNHNLTGSIPQSIGGLQSLEYLDLSDNNLMGPIPSSIGRLKFLEYLDLNTNNLTGFIPRSVGGLQSLKDLDLSANKLTGLIPQSIGGLHSLESLDLSENNLSGPLPSSLWELKSLQYLDLSSNSLRGNLTEEHFVHLSNLTTMELSSNSIHFTLSPRWIPPFHLEKLGLGSCKVGLDFPLWLQTQNKIRELNMSNCGISDVLPQWIWNFSRSSHFTIMDLSMNKLRGVVPVGTGSSGMESLILHSNMLEGSLSSLPHISDQLLLSSNLFSGPINIASMSSMSVLSLSRNNLTGNIPPSFCKAQRLGYIDLSYNRLSGRLPSCIADQMCFIRSLHLNNNSLRGTLPAWLGNCKQMQLLDLGENNFSGEFPNWISNRMSYLKVLRLRSNSFYGSIPMELSNMTRLQVFDLADNSFTGPIPPTVGNFSAMKIPLSGDVILGYYSGGYYKESIVVTTKGHDQMVPESVLKLYTSIDLSGNKLLGDIPDEVGKLAYLRNLNLSHNYFSGRIPETFAKLSQLESLDLSRNNISGGIPNTLAGLTFLSTFNVSYNNLSGRIPSGGQFDRFTNSSYMGNLDLCGKPLQVCQSDLSPPINGYSMQTEKDHDHYFVWLCLSIVLGFIMGFWTYMGTLILKRNWRYAYFQFVDQQCEKYYLRAKHYVGKCKRMCLKS